MKELSCTHTWRKRCIVSSKRSEKEKSVKRKAFLVKPVAQLKKWDYKIFTDTN